MLVRCAILFCLFLACVFTRSAAPDLKSVYPVAGSPGTNHLIFYNNFEPWPPKVWSHPPGVTFIAETNKNRFIAIVETNAVPGPRLVRVYNDEGASDPQFFIVDPSPQLEEKEPNNKFTEPQEPATLPVTINGRLNARDDADNFRVHLKKGEWLEASLEAYTLMSKFDGVLRLLTTNGVTLAWNHDYATLDPRLWHQASSNQTVIVQLFGFVYPANNEIRLYGGDESNYRLHLSHSPPPSWTNEISNGLALPISRSGTLSNVGQEDRFEFSAKKDDVIEARIEAARIGSPLDAWLKISDAAGKQLAREDDSDGSRDPRIEWKAPADTNYFFTISSTLNRASTNHHYRFTARTLTPDYLALWSVNSLLLTNNSTNTVKLDLKRLRGHTNNLAAAFKNLPAGVTASPMELTNKSGEIVFTLAATNAEPFQGPIQLELLDAVTKSTNAAIVELTSRGENNGVPNGYSTLLIDSYDHIWLTLRPEPPPKQIAATNPPSKE